MRVVIGSDHGGFQLKNVLVEYISQSGHEVIDVGTETEKSVDYPDYAEKVGNLIQSGDADRGIVLCGSGVGGCIAANKMKGIYAAICHDSYSAGQGVEHDNMNVLCLGGRIIGDELAKKLVSEFLKAKFIGNEPGEDRHLRRTAKIRSIEEKGTIG
jgi:RpiB/LacA/LacB family sugar-phosphate isomerase